MKIEAVYPKLNDTSSKEELDALNVAFERGSYSVLDAIHLEIRHEHLKTYHDYVIKDNLVMRCEKNVFTGDPMYSDCKGVLINITNH